MKKHHEGYTYQHSDRDGTFDMIEIINPMGQVIAFLYYSDELFTDEAHEVETSARIICRHLNKWKYSVTVIQTDKPSA